MIEAIDDDVTKYFKGQASLAEATTKATQDADAISSA